MALNDTSVCVATRDDTPFLLTRPEAAKRYGLSVRGLEEMYRRHPEFPLVRIGRKVLVHRDMADAFFTEYVNGVVE